MIQYSISSPFSRGPAITAYLRGYDGCINAIIRPAKYPLPFGLGTLQPVVLGFGTIITLP